MGNSSTKSVIESLNEARLFPFLMSSTTSSSNATTKYATLLVASETGVKRVFLTQTGNKIECKTTPLVSCIRDSNFIGFYRDMSIGEIDNPMSQDVVREYEGLIVAYQKQPYDKYPVLVCQMEAKDLSHSFKLEMYPSQEHPSDDSWVSSHDPLSKVTIPSTLENTSLYMRDADQAMFMIRPEPQHQYLIPEDIMNDELPFLVSNTITSSCHPLASSPTNIFAVYPFAHTLKSDMKFAHSILTGSTAEFYISPVLSCTGDIDMMAFRRGVLVVETDNPEFPDVSELFEEFVKVLKIEPIDKYPGYVRLLFIGAFVFSRIIFEYIYVKNQSDVYPYYQEPRTTIQENSEFKYDGPAKSYASTKVGITRPRYINHYYFPEVFVSNEARLLPRDLVMSYSCYTWPSVAAEWKLRDRPHAWPSVVMIHNVVAGGCDVVHVSHPNCRDDEYMHRLSFSRAEVMLIRSWSHVQQVVYHMLRFFAKQELVNPKKKKVPTATLR